MPLDKAPARVFVTDKPVMVDAVGIGAFAGRALDAQFMDIHPGDGFILRTSNLEDGVQDDKLKETEPLDGLADEGADRLWSNELCGPITQREVKGAIGMEDFAQLGPRPSCHDIRIAILQPPQSDIVDRFLVRGSFHGAGL